MSILFLQGNKIAEALSLLNEAKEMLSAQTESVQQPQSINKKNSTAYLHYLDKLLPKVPEIEVPHECQILHIGESHSLAFINQRIRTKDADLLVKSSLIKGAKAFHLRNHLQKAFKRLGSKRVRRRVLRLINIFFFRLEKSIAEQMKEF